MGTGHGHGARDMGTGHRKHHPCPSGCPQAAAGTPAGVDPGSPRWRRTCTEHRRTRARYCQPDADQPVTAAKPQARSPGAAGTQSIPLPPWGQRGTLPAAVLARCPEGWGTRGRTGTAWWPSAEAQEAGTTWCSQQCHWDPQTLQPALSGPTREGREGRIQGQTRSPGSVALLRAAAHPLVPDPHLIPGACSQKGMLEWGVQTQGRWSCDRVVTHLSPRGPRGGRKQRAKLCPLCP